MPNTNDTSVNCFSLLTVYSCARSGHLIHFLYSCARWSPQLQNKHVSPTWSPSFYHPVAVRICNVTFSWKPQTGIYEVKQAGLVTYSV